MDYEYLNPDQMLCVNMVLIQISLNRFAVCKWGFMQHTNYMYTRRYMNTHLHVHGCVGTIV